MHTLIYRFGFVLILPLTVLWIFTQTVNASSSVSIHVPPVAVTQADQSLQLAAVTFDTITLDGVVEADDRVTLAVTNGSLSLAQTTGLAFEIGDGTDDATMTFGGGLAAINLALDGLTYSPTPSFAGRSTLTVAISGTQTATATLNIAVNATIDGESARTTLLNGVSTIHGGVQPGNVVAFGPTAYAINHFSDGNAWIAAATLGQGRIIAVPDHQGLNMGNYGDEGDSGQLYKNGVAWLADSTALDVAIVTFDANVTTWLSGQGYTNVSSTDSSGLAADLVGADIFIGGWIGSNPSQATIDTLRDFALGGGGLFLADYGIGYDWWWGRSHHEIGSNRLLREAGLAFGGGYHWGNGTFDATLRASGQTSATQILALLDDSSGASDDLKNKVGIALGHLFSVLPPDDPLLQQLDQRYTARINTIYPTPATPVSDAFDQALLTREAALLQAQSVYDVRVHRTITGTYGMIPDATPRISRTVNIDSSRTRFQLTGLYAAPGDVVTVTVPSALVGQGYRVRIGTNTDNIAARSDWRRVPIIHRSFVIDNAVVPVASAFGGSIIIDLGGDTYGSPANIGPQPVQIEGAIEQPYFVLGQHTNADWLNSLRDKPAVRAALVSTHTIITVPSSYIATLDDPETLMAWWDDVTAGQDDLVGRHTPRTAAEIINVDIQNSAGAAHAGYPIQAWDIHWGNPANLNTRTGGSWGDFHEVGHNHQRGWWTFDGDGEVSVNIFSNFNLETDAISADSGSGWGYSIDPISSIEQAKSDLAGGPYDDNSNRWSFWFVLADVPGGWENFRCAFRTYEDDFVSNPSALPITNAEEQGQWLVRFSTCAGWDMRRVMVDTWGLAATTAQINAIAALPDYMPLETNYTAATVEAGVAITLDLQGNAVTLDNTATLVSHSTPMNGVLTNNGDGTATYTSNIGFDGADHFTYTLQSSADNTRVVTMTLDVYPCGDPLIVTHSADSGKCSLRNALASATDGDTIRFDPRVEDKPIYLASRLIVNRDVTIDGGDVAITISGDSDQDGDGDVQIFEINANPVYLYNLNLVDARSSTGAMIVTWSDHAIISNTTFANNVSTYYGGGAIHSQSRVSIYNSTFSNNRSSGTGEALALRSSNNVIVHSTFVGNGDGTTISLSDGTGWVLHNSILSNTVGTACSGSAPAASSGNLIFDNTCDTARATAASGYRMGTLANNGNGRLTHALSFGSPAIGTANSAECLPVDQLGNLRNDGYCDAGSVEYVYVPTSVVTLRGQAATSNHPQLYWGIVAYALFSAAILHRRRNMANVA